MSKKVKNMIIYTMIIVTITTGINFMIMNKIYNDKINKINTEVEVLENEQNLEYLTTMCSFEKDEIVCD